MNDVRTTPYYTASGGHVDGAFTIGEYPTLAEAIDACRADMEHVPAGDPAWYRVKIQYGYYRDEPRDVRWYAFSTPGGWEYSAVDCGCGWGALCDDPDGRCASMRERSS